ncbi:MAG TPA: hypothetical protein VMV32_01695, partial [Ignavibacteriaceae bacterium]|nr:hypothetical protein [Ignavibacteriaceae bacterium]
INGAKDALLDTDIDNVTLVLSGTPSATSIVLTWNIQPFAEYYEIYHKGTLLDTVEAQITTYSYSYDKQPTGRKNVFKVRGVSSTQTSAYSNEYEHDYYYQAGVLVTRTEIVPPTIATGYGYNYGNNYGN